MDDAVFSMLFNSLLNEFCLYSRIVLGCFSYIYKYYRNNCAKYELEVPKSKWEITPKVVKNDKAKINYRIKQ